MSELYPNHFYLQTYQESVSEGRCINVAEVSDDIYIKYPPSTSARLELSSVSQIGGKSGTIEPTEFTQDGKTVWLKTDKANLDMSIGFHVYRFRFYDTELLANIDYYISYFVQDDDPEKPYIYMKRSAET